MDWRQLISYLDQGQELTILVHERPDGDAWGSGLGLGLVLEDLGYKPRLLRPRRPPYAFAWLPGQHLIQVVAGEEWVWPANGAVVTVDCGDGERCEYKLGDRRVLLNADHHVSNPGFGVLNWVDSQAGATAQILCRLLLAGGVAVSPAAATCFYAALVTDTGGFRFSNTGGETLAVAAQLAYGGADLGLIRRRLWENRPRPELTLLREMMARLVLLAGERAVFCALPYETMIEKGILDADTETAIDALRGVEGVEVIALLKETAPEVVKISLRSKETLDCAAFMARLGGGGHVRAAGGTWRGPLPAAEKELTRLLIEALTPGDV
ncbi:MAG: DHH family phosphoesterase [Peptococcaceae bacterium]|jgi:phosphoesterase RecJ-like protein|nr:DHH family phosphoesterase [Peptococcaceae bacterium]